MNRLRALLAAAALAFALAPASAPAEEAASLHPKLKMETSLGTITLELDAERAPISTLNFVRYAEEKFYDGLVFHRVMSDFMIQGGGYTPALDEKSQGLHEPIKNEWRNGLKNVRGTIAMARTNQPDSATAQFFINVVDNAALDNPQPYGAAYAVFGKVVDGMDTVDKIRNTPVKNDPKYPGGQVVPVEPVVIKSVTVAGKLDKDKAQAQVKMADEIAKKAQAEADAAKEKIVQEVIKKYEDQAKTKSQKTASGLVYIPMKEGAGESPKATDKVTVHYTGTFLDGKKFDSSVDRGKPAQFPLNGVIKGWTEGVAMMKPGGKAILVCPPNLAYGPQGRPGIPPNSTLVFEVELISVP